jgi:hypothetical protein
MALAQADLSKVEAKPLLLAGNTNPFANFAKKAHAFGLVNCAKGS